MCRAGGDDKRLAAGRIAARANAARRWRRECRPARPSGLSPPRPPSAIGPGIGGPTNCTPSAVLGSPGCGESPDAAHIIGFIAGATSTGLSEASSTSPARSSQRRPPACAMKIGGGWRNDHQIGLARQADMPHIVLVIATEQLA